MKVAIIGAGFTGLSAAIDLVEARWEVTIFEAEKRPGGWRLGFWPRAGTGVWSVSTITFLPMTKR